MRISDWSSDVCSSDLVDVVEAGDRDHRSEDLALHDLVVLQGAGHHGRLVEEAVAVGGPAAGGDLDVLAAGGALDEAGDAVALARRDERADLVLADRKSVVSGKSVSVRVDFGGRRIIKTKKEPYS